MVVPNVENPKLGDIDVILERLMRKKTRYPIVVIFFLQNEDQTCSVLIGEMQ